MSQAFTLARIKGRDYCPATGEDLGSSLRRAALALEEQRRGTETACIAHWGNDVAQLAYLAAEAFEQASSASIGHNRSARYDEQAKALRTWAAELEDKAKAQRDEHEAKRMLHAFEAGWLGTDENFSFDARDAFIVGKHFREQGLPVAKSVICERSQVFIVDGVKWLVIFPEGKINKAIVAKETFQRA